jgi:L-rhamnose mutarotase
MPDNGRRRIRKLYRRRLRPCKVASYCEYHRSIKPELEALYREHGLTSISSFLNGNELCVLVEYDPAIYARKRAQLDKHPLEQKWQALMATLDEPEGETIEYEEVYRLSAKP